MQRQLYWIQKVGHNPGDAQRDAPICSSRIKLRTRRIKLWTTRIKSWT